MKIVREYPIVCMSINLFAQNRLDILFEAKAKARWMVSSNHHGVGNGEEILSVFVGHIESGAEFRDATST